MRQDVKMCFGDDTLEFKIVSSFRPVTASYMTHPGLTEEGRNFTYSTAFATIKSNLLATCLLT